MNHEERDPRLHERLAELPRSIEPAHDLWPQIRQRIEAGKVMQPDFGATARPGRIHRYGLLAAAASLLVIVSSATTAWWMRGSDPQSLPGVEAVSATPAGWTEFTAAEREYQRVTDDLMATLEARRDRLAPETVRVVEENLRLIEQAIQEARAALERDPANAGLATKVTDIYRRRVDFLRQINRL